MTASSLSFAWARSVSISAAVSASAVTLSASPSAWTASIWAAAFAFAASVASANREAASCRAWSSSRRPPSGLPQWRHRPWLRRIESFRWFLLTPGSPAFLLFQPGRIPARKIYSRGSNGHHLKLIVTKNAKTHFPLTENERSKMLRLFLYDTLFWLQNQEKSQKIKRIVQVSSKIIPQYKDGINCKKKMLENSIYP